MPKELKPVTSKSTLVTVDLVDQINARLAEAITYIAGGCGIDANASDNASAYSVELQTTSSNEC